MKVLLTGGAGYIGSHTAVELLNAGHEVVIADDYSNSSSDVPKRIMNITGKQIDVYEMDVTDIAALDKLFDEQCIDAVIHFAGFKAVGESVDLPLKYYRNNIDSALSVLETMEKHHVNTFVFSSSATVYGNARKMPVDESSPTGGCSNPYGWTKYMIEQILRDAATARKELSVVLLRYFNPAGAHESGLLGERPQGIPNNLMPYIAQTAAGIRDHVNIFGDDYPTRDGTGVRDYIHVVDLAKGHLAALEYAEKNTGSKAFNLGTGTGYSVLEMLKAFEAVNEVEIPYVIAPRRSGDIAEIYADPRLAEQELHWTTEKSLEDICRDGWRWERNIFTGV